MQYFFHFQYLFFMQYLFSCSTFFHFQYLHSWQKALSLLMQHLKNPPVSLKYENVGVLNEKILLPVKKIPACHLALLCKLVIRKTVAVLRTDSRVKG